MFGHSPTKISVPLGGFPSVHLHLGYLVVMFSEANKVCFMVSHLHQPLARLGKTLVVCLSGYVFCKISKGRVF